MPRLNAKTLALQRRKKSLVGEPVRFTNKAFFVSRETKAPGQPGTKPRHLAEYPPGALKIP
jgi:hypothetical protein